MSVPTLREVGINKGDRPTTYEHLEVPQLQCKQYQQGTSLTAAILKEETGRTLLHWAQFLQPGIICRGNVPSILRLKENCSAYLNSGAVSRVNRGIIVFHLQVNISRSSVAQKR